MPTGFDILKMLFSIANDYYDFTNTLTEVHKMALDHMKTSDVISRKQSVIYLGFFKQFCFQKQWMPFYNDLV